jgi:hypothetical protein
MSEQYYEKITEFEEIYIMKEDNKDTLTITMEGIDDAIVMDFTDDEVEDLYQSLWTYLHLKKIREVGIKEKVYCSDCKFLKTREGAISILYECHSEKNTKTRFSDSWLHKSFIIESKIPLKG